VAWFYKGIRIRYSTACVIRGEETIKILRIFIANKSLMQRARAEKRSELRWMIVEFVKARKTISTKIGSV
jgi:hypothetical protein